MPRHFIGLGASPPVPGACRQGTFLALTESGPLLRGTLLALALSAHSRPLNVKALYWPSRNRGPLLRGALLALGLPGAYPDNMFGDAEAGIEAEKRCQAT
jgi:hypothetical protein